jgi:hypothetical protein
MGGGTLDVAWARWPRAIVVAAASQVWNGDFSFLSLLFADYLGDDDYGFFKTMVIEPSIV